MTGRSLPPLLAGLSALVLINLKFLPRDQSQVGERGAELSEKSAYHPHPLPDRAAPQPTIQMGFEEFVQAAATAIDRGKRRELLREWADSIPLGVMAETLIHLDRIENPELQSAFRLALLSRWAEVNPAAAMQAVHSGSIKRAEDQAAVLQTWAERDLAGALEWFAQQTASDEFRREAHELLGRALGQLPDPAAAFWWLEAWMPESLCAELCGPFFQKWADLDPAAAGSMLLQLADPSLGKPWFRPLGQDLIGQVAARWANADINRAADWVQSLPDGTAKTEALVQISARWAGADAQTAAAVATRHNDARMLDRVARAWAEQEPLAAATWAGQQVNREPLLAAILAVWAEHHPMEAAKYAASLPGGPAKDAATRSVVTTWGPSEPMKVLAWVNELADHHLRERALSHLLVPWAGSDPVGATTWLNTLEIGRPRDEAVSHFVSVIQELYPASALHWAAAITDERARLQQMERTARVWLAADPVAAQNAIVHSALSEELKKSFLRALPASSR